MEVINLFAGPGAGKSTTAAGLFHEMKCRGINVELVTEYAKDMTWEGRENILGDQLYMLAKQNRRLERLKNQVEWVITDSPLLLCINYVKDDYLPGVFGKLVAKLFGSYCNNNIFIDRVKPYNPTGRSQSIEQAKKLDQKILSSLDSLKVDYTIVRGDQGATKTILEHLEICGKI